MPPSHKPAARPASTRYAIGLVVDRWDWHARELARAFAALGADTFPIDLAACGFDTQSAYGLAIPGRAQLPVCVLVRTMSGGTFEAVTMRLGFLHALNDRGALVWNDARAI